MEKTNMSGISGKRNKKSGEVRREHYQGAFYTSGKAILLSKDHQAGDSRTRGGGVLHHERGHCGGNLLFSPLTRCRYSEKEMVRNSAYLKGGEGTLTTFCVMR